MDNSYIFVMFINNIVQEENNVTILTMDWICQYTRSNGKEYQDEEHHGENVM